MAFKALPQMSLMESVKTCYQKYFTFSGRARRSEFWWFWLVAGVVQTVLLGIVRHFHTAAAEAFTKDITLDNFSEMYDKAHALDHQYQMYYIIVLVVILVLFTIPLLAAHARRLHDIGKSGYLLFLYLLCGVGGLIPLFMCIKDGEPAANQYGESPKYVEEV